MPSGPDAAAAQADLWVIEPRQHGVWYRARELWRYRYLWWYFAKDTLTSLYRRSKLGWLWLVMRALAPVGLNGLLFGGIMGAGQNLPVPYPVFLMTGMAPWVLFERSLIYVTRSLERNRKLVTKIYFPRLILPISAVAPGLLFFAILVGALAATVVVYHQREAVWHVTLRPQLLFGLAAVAMSLSFTVAVGLWTSVLQARYRDIRYGLRYTLPFGLYFTPILWEPEELGDQQWLLGFNPLWPIVKLFRWATIGSYPEFAAPTPVEMFASVSLIAVVMITGMWFFNREEATSIDKM
jgi:lipopolysaccharide transport system permease protein